MNDKRAFSTGQLFNVAPNSYLERTSRPVYALVFLLPFIVFYELGTIFINTRVLAESEVRVVAFVWLQNFLEYLGFGSRFAWAAPALAVVVILSALQLVSGKRWRFQPGDVCPMAIECSLLAIPLIVLSLFLSSSGRAQGQAMRFGDRPVQAQTEAVLRCLADTNEDLSTGQQSSVTEPRSQSLLADIVTGIGAGIYEELVFRLILIIALMVVFQDVLRLSHRDSIIFSVLVSAALFSAHHHIFFLDGQFGQSSPFNWAEFGFRTIAGVYFAALFAIRGFGITAGTHAFYDIIATIINTVFFQR